MDIIIGKRMRQLRNIKKNTQEQLAAHLGVSSQAVSKWERGEGYPDITLLPGIAAFYDVSTDTLLGVDESEKQKKLKEYLQKDKALSYPAERVALWKEAYREFPNEPAVLHGLSFALRAENLQENAQEIIALAKRLLKEATQSGEYFGAVNNLCRAYKALGDLEEAKRYAAMAGRYVGTENQLMIHLLEGEEAVAFCQWNIETLIDLAAANAGVMLKKGSFTMEESIRVSEFVIKLFELVFDDGNYGFYYCRLCKWHLRIAKLYAQLGSKEKALQHLESALKDASAYDTLSQGKYSALVVNRQSYTRSENAESQMAACRDAMYDACFDLIREDPRFPKLQDIED